MDTYVNYRQKQGGGTLTSEWALTRDTTAQIRTYVHVLPVHNIYMYLYTHMGPKMVKIYNRTLT